MRLFVEILYISWVFGGAIFSPFMVVMSVMASFESREFLVMPFFMFMIFTGLFWWWGYGVIKTYNETD